MPGHSNGPSAAFLAAISAAGQTLLVASIVWVGMTETARHDLLLQLAASFGMVVLVAAASLAGSLPSLPSLALGVAGILLALAQGFPGAYGVGALAALCAAWIAGTTLRWRREQSDRHFEDLAAAAVASAIDREAENESALRRIQALEASIAQMPALEELAVRLVALTKESEVAEAILDAALVLCPRASVARIFTAEGSALRILSVRCREPLEEADRERLSKADSIDLAVLEKRDPVLVPNASPGEGRFDARSVACTPLLEEEERFGGTRESTCRGLLRIQAVAAGALGRDDLENLNILASLAAVSLQNTRLLQRVEDLVIFDPLTGLHTMRYFRERFPEEASRAERSRHPLGLLLFDLDDFKRINDTRGHLAGDEALVRFAGLLQAYLRNGYIAARYGGDEFAMLLPERHPGAVREAADEIRERTAALAGDVPITTSVGIAFSSPGPVDPDGLLKLADGALYRAKREGKNRVVLSEAVP
ncbi:MAG: sensor domain-containing diguanylate cyclase [Planctomycetota bacterium]